MLLFGDSSTGKSVILNLVEKILPEHTVKLSARDALSRPNLAVNIVGKRVCIGSESSINFKDLEKFRSLISGESVYIKIFYKGEYNISHNAVFINATNDVAPIVDRPENRKRIRVVKFENPIPREKQDLKFLDKLFDERVAIIKKCLSVFQKYSGEPFPENRSTDEYFNNSCELFNPVSAWLKDNGIETGDNFISTKMMHELYSRDMGRKDFNIFSRELARAIKLNGVKRKIDGHEKRGYCINQIF